MDSLPSTLLLQNYSAICESLIKFQSQNVFVVTQDPNILTVVWIAGALLVLKEAAFIFGRVFKNKPEHITNLLNKLHNGFSSGLDLAVFTLIFMLINKLFL